MALPDFFVIGVPKAGTTALHVALARHPQLFMSEIKEPKYFLCDGPPPQRGGPGDAKSFRARVWRRKDYEALFDCAPAGTLRGESTPFYLYDPDAQRRLHDAVPHARLIALLRDPIDRAHSNWTHLWSAGLEPEQDFVKACRLEDQRAAAGWASFWRYLDLGRYGEQLQRLYARFPREHVLVLRYQQLHDEPERTLDRICAFLGVDTGVISEIPAENVTTHVTASQRNRTLAVVLRAGAAIERHLPPPVWRSTEAFLSQRIQTEQRRREPLTAAQRAELLPHFEQDIALLEELTGLAFDEWRQAEHSPRRKDIRPDGRIGTAFNSIDQPIRDAADDRPA
jgi:hypothetical protein